MLYTKLIDDHTTLYYYVSYLYGYMRQRKSIDKRVPTSIPFDELPLSTNNTLLVWYTLHDRDDKPRCSVLPRGSFEEDFGALTLVLKCLS